MKRLRLQRLSVSCSRHPEFDDPNTGKGMREGRRKRTIKNSGEGEEENEDKVKKMGTWEKP